MKRLRKGEEREKKRRKKIMERESGRVKGGEKEDF